MLTEGRKTNNFFLEEKGNRKIEMSEKGKFSPNLENNNKSEL